MISFLVALVVGAACGYGFRGLIHKQVVAAGSALQKDAANVAADAIKKA